MADIHDRHENVLFLPGIALPPDLRASQDLEEVVSGAELVILVPPSKHLRSVSSEIAPYVDPDAVLTIASKGIEEEKLELMSQVLTETMPDYDPKNFVFLSGPTFAREVASGLPTDVVAASKGMKAARRLQPWLHSPTFRVYTSGDPVGVEVGGAMKNVIAVAAGASDGLDLGSNARAALITRGLAEITRLGVALGADPLTFLGMSGVGDLVLTCTGDLSRNRHVGLELGRGKKLAQILGEMTQVAEGVRIKVQKFQITSLMPKGTLKSA